MSAKRLQRGWYIADYDRDFEIVRGPFANSALAGAIRGEIERNPEEERNLWIVSDKSLRTLPRYTQTALPSPESPGRGAASLSGRDET